MPSRTVRKPPFPISTLHEKPYLPVSTSTLRHQKGFVWLESSQGTPGGICLAATEPDLILEGKASDWQRIERELETRKRPAITTYAPDGAAIGYFRFDGSFCFGFYDQLEIENCPVLPPEPPPSQAPLPALDFKSDTGIGEYLQMVRRAQEYIAAGDIYQVCLAHRFSTTFVGDPWPLYQKLREASPAPYAAYLSLGDETILSSSPECFLKMSGRKILTRPIKGTRPRRLDHTEDEREASELCSSPKEIAELIMITDLERNDLGSVCEYGTVTAPRLVELERYAQVFHLVSTVEGILREEVSHVAAVAACFPGGSISGAPKKRALEIIQELEPTPRGLFTGAIGYFGYNGESQFNIAIRTLVIRDGMAEFHVGAGITADSDPEKEWEETLHKAAGILKASKG